MRRYLVGQLGTGIVALPWITGGAIAVAVSFAAWCHPVTTRAGRCFPTRVRESRVEFGHVKDADPNIDTGR